MNSTRMYVLLNAGAGTLLSDPKGAGEIEAEFARHGVEATAVVVESGRLDDEIRKAVASDAEVIVAGGGDGTINAVAQAVAASGKVLGVLPVGTMNHLAKELGAPLELPAAVEAIAKGQAQGFNVGEVNGHIFLNSSAIGLYSEMIKHRDAQQRARGRSKWVAMTLAMLRTFIRFPLFVAQLRFGSRRLTRLTPLVFVSLSESHRKRLGVDGLGRGGRETLSVFVAKRLRRLSVVWSILRALLGKVSIEQDLDVVCADEVELVTHRRHLRVAVDGEVMDMTAPLQYRFRRNGIRVMMPATANTTEARTDEQAVSITGSR